MRHPLEELQALIRELKADASLLEPARFRARIEALNRLEAFHLDSAPVDSETFEAIDSDSELHRSARALRTSLEATNSKLYDGIRERIRLGDGRNALLEWALPSGSAESASGPVNGESYDHLDELVSGVLQFEKPDAEIAVLPPEMVPYQPTPARHIFDLIRNAQVTAQDVLIDLGSGLGHVPLLASICTNARCVGVEIEAAYVHCACRAAFDLNLRNATFMQGDAREVDLSNGTVFYLYTPFRGPILRTTLDLLRHEAARREIRVCTFGPCTPIVADECWLEPIASLETGRVARFRSRN